jgi:hypothetical protein
MPTTMLTPAASDAKIRRDLLIRRIIHLAIAVAVIVPFVHPFSLTVKPSPVARQLYDGIDALPPKSPVLLSLDFDPASEAELSPMSLALLRHCFKKDLHPVVMTFWNTGLGLHKGLLERAAGEYGKQTGIDYVFLGFKPAGANLILNMGESLTGAFDKDYYGKPTEGMAALTGVKTIKDMKYAVDLAAGNTVETWIAYGHDRFGFPLGAGCTAVIAPDLYPFWQSKQLTGLLGGLRGAADYETMVGASGVATAGMQAQSITHVLIIVLILIANAELLMSRMKRKRE